MFVTTIKHAKQVLSIFLTALLLCQSAVAAGQKTKYELGLEQAANGKWAIAIKYFQGVSEDDPQYKEARKQIVIAQNEQEKLQVKSNFENKFKKETDKCRDLFHIERSPETQKCIDRVNELYEEGSRKFGAVALPSYETLTADYSPYRTINEVTDRVRGIAMDINGIDNAGSDLMFIESFVADPKMPVDAKVIGAIVGTQIFKGATLAFAQACEDARAGTDQNAANKICNRRELALGKYASFRNFVIENSPALIGKSVPLMIWNDYNPLSQTVSALPHPDAVLANVKNVNTNSNTPRLGSGEFGTQNTQVIQPVEEQPSSWMPVGAIAAVATLVAVLGVSYWKFKPKAAATPSPQLPEATTVKTATSPIRPNTPPKTTAVLNAVAQGTVKAVSPTASGMMASAVSSAVSIASSPEVIELKKLIAAWVNGAAVPKAKDTALSALMDYCAKVGVDIVQQGQPRSATLIATVSNPDSVSELAAEFMRLVLQARRNN